MIKLRYRTSVFAFVALLGACGRDPLAVPDDMAGQGGTGVPTTGKGGAGGVAGGGGGGAGGTVVVRLPDGGISALLGDSGILNGIMDAPRDSMLGQIICPPEARLGAKCSAGSPPCLLPSLGGACTCVSETYVCPFDTTSGPQPCPSGAATGGSCLSPLAVCIGGGANACICLGTYTCF
jgi:hypothetical protein